MKPVNILPNITDDPFGYSHAMKVKKTLIFPFEQRALYTTSRQSLMRMAASWLETTMNALKESKKQASVPEPSKIRLFRKDRLIRNCTCRAHNYQGRYFQPVPQRQRLSLFPSHSRTGRHHW